jgi:RNA polymerase sigma-70 factor (ECF subfamily)
MNNEILQELVSIIGNNKDRAAFSKLFDYFAPRIMGYLINSGSQKEFAEEITQEVLSTVWLKSFMFNPKKGNVSTWIFTIARNKRVDKLRKNQKPIYNNEDLIDALYSTNIQESNIQEKIEEIQSILTDNEKKLIKMNFFEGKSHKNISRDLEIPLGTVKSRLRNTINKIKKTQK